MEINDNDLVWAKVRPDAIIPTKEDEDAGYDIYANFEEDYIVIPPHSTKMIPTGIASAMTDKWYLNVAERGSTGVKGMKYGAGIIDSGFRGEINIVINNINDKPIILSKLSNKDLNDELLIANEVNDNVGVDKNCIIYCNGKIDAIIYPYEKAIAQLILHEVPKMNVCEISYEELKNIPSKRGLGKLGSSNK